MLSTKVRSHAAMIQNFLSSHYQAHYFLLASITRNMCYGLLIVQDYVKAMTHMYITCLIPLDDVSGYIVLRNILIA